MQFQRGGGAVAGFASQDETHDAASGTTIVGVRAGDGEGHVSLAGNYRWWMGGITARILANLCASDKERDGGGTQRLFQCFLQAPKVGGGFHASARAVLLG